MMVVHKVVCFLLFLLCGCAYRVLGDEEVDSDVEDTAPVPPIDDIDGMIAYLQHEDTRLIRYNVPSELVWLRQDKLCSQHLESLLKLLATRFDASPKVPLGDQAKIVKLLSLCSSEHPEFREKIGTFEDSVGLKAVVSLLDEDDDAVTAAVGDAIWILSFANQNNHEYFAKHAIEKMASIIVKKAADTSSSASLAVMWMAAALQNLAASYCGTDSGHCWWLYEFPSGDPDQDESEYGLYLHDESPLIVDASAAATAIFQSAGGELVKTLHKLVCAEPMTGDDYSIWASEATVEGSGIVDPRIVTWAVAGLLKNLSMYEGSYAATYEARECLCLLTQSEDWLESSKAEDAIYRSGFTAEDCWGDQEEEEEEYGEEL